MCCFFEGDLLIRVYFASLTVLFFTAPPHAPHLLPDWHLWQSRAVMFFLKLDELNRQQRWLLSAPLVFIFWPLLNFDWTPVSELRLSEDQLIHRLHQRSLPLVSSSCPTVPPNLGNWVNRMWSLWNELFPQLILISLCLSLPFTQPTNQHSTHV